MSIARFVLFAVGAVSVSVVLSILNPNIFDLSGPAQENATALPILFQAIAFLGIAGALGFEIGLKVFGRKARSGPALAAGIAAGTIVFLALLAAGRLASSDGEQQFIVALASFWVSFGLALLFR